MIDQTEYNSVIQPLQIWRQKYFLVIIWSPICAVENTFQYPIIVKNRQWKYTGDRIRPKFDKPSKTFLYLKICFLIYNNLQNTSVLSSSICHCLKPFPNKLKLVSPGKTILRNSVSSLSKTSHASSSTIFFNSWIFFSTFFKKIQTGVVRLSERLSISAIIFMAFWILKNWYKNFE